MPSKNKGGQPPQRGSRAMVETIAVTDGELTALSALSGHQLSSTEIESLASIQAELDRLNAAHGVQEVEDAVCVTVPPEDSMEVEESQQTQDVEMPDSTTPTSAVVVESAPSAIARAAVLPSVVSAAAASTSYVVIQSSPGNRVLTTNSNVQAKKGTQIMGRLSTGAPQIQQVQLKAAVNTSAGASSGTGPPPLVSRGATFTVSGVRALNPGSRPPVVTKVVLPRQGGNPHVMAIPISDSKTMDSHRIVTLGGPHVKVLSGGMKVATINQSDLKELPENVATGSPARPLVVQTRQILSPSKVQQILPSSPGGKGLVVNRVISSSGPRVTVIPQGAKSPAKILPAPISTSGSCTTQSGSTISPQKVIIRQTPLKPMTSGGQQVLRISTSTQPVSSTSSAFQSVQVAGRTMQYVRLVSIPSSSTTTTVTSGGVGKGSTVLTLAPTPVSQVGGVKMIPITPVATPRPVGTKTTGQKIMIPASIAMTQIRAPVPTSVIASTTTTASITSIDSSNIVMLSTAAAQVSRNKIIAQTPIAQLSPQPVVSQEQVREEKPTPKLQITTAPQQPPQPKQKPSKQVKEESQEEAEQQTVQPGQPAPPPQQVQVPALIKSAASKITSEPNGIRPRKPCNCTKSQCLKLYCDCFANGEFCYQCNCNCCFNNLEHEEDRQRAIRSCLERNPNAFRPKIGKGQVGDGRRHNKGCNCKRSGCLKNYCECYEAKIACSNNCKCVGCRNIEEDLDKRSLRDLMEVAERESRLIQAPVPKKKTSLIPSDSSAKHEAAAALLTPGIVAASVRAPTPTGTEIGTSTSSLADEEDDEDEPPTKTYRRPLNLMSDEVVNATCQCLLATAEKAEKSKLKEEDAERLIIEEFGRCLVEIIASVTSRTDDSHSLCE